MSPGRAEWKTSATCVELGANALYAFVFVIVLFYQPSISSQIGKCGDLAVLSTGEREGCSQKKEREEEGALRGVLFFWKRGRQTDTEKVN